MSDGSSVTVLVPTPLRRFAGGSAKLEATGDTLGAVLGDLEARYPDLAERIVEDGRIRRFVNIFVNGTNVRDLQGEETPVKAGDEIDLIPAMAGGATA